MNESKKVLISRKGKQREMKIIAFDCSRIEIDGCFKRHQREINNKKKSTIT